MGDSLHKTGRQVKTKILQPNEEQEKLLNMKI